MNKIYGAYIIYLSIFWYFSDWIVVIMAYWNNKSTDKATNKKNDEKYKELTVLRHVICGFIMICFIYHLMNEQALTKLFQFRTLYTNEYVMICINFVHLNFTVMTSTEKSEVLFHVLKASRLEEKDKRYKAIQHLFRVDQLSFMFFEINFALDIRRGLLVLGLECEVSRNKVILEEGSIIKYYENIMGLKAEPKEEEKSYYQRRLNTDSDK